MTAPRPRRFDITRTQLKNFRNIARCDISLSSLALLVGPNGSG